MVLMRTDAQRRAQNKYEKNKYTVLGCKVKKEEADLFRDACKDAGTTPNAVFRSVINDFINKKEP